MPSFESSDSHPRSPEPPFDFPELERAMDRITQEVLFERVVLELGRIAQLGEKNPQSQSYHHTYVPHDAGSACRRAFFLEYRVHPVGVVSRLIVNDIYASVSGDSQAEIHDFVLPKLSTNIGYALTRRLAGTPGVEKGQLRAAAGPILRITESSRQLQIKRDEGYELPLPSSTARIEGIDQAGQFEIRRKTQFFIAEKLLDISSTLGEDRSYEPDILLDR